MRWTRTMREEASEVSGFLVKHQVLGDDGGGVCQALSNDNHSSLYECRTNCRTFYHEMIILISRFHCQ